LSRALRIARVAACAAALVAAGLPLPYAFAETKRTLIFVVDSSERMIPYMSAVRGAIFTAADQSGNGDHLGIISSSNMAKRVVSKKISGPRDRNSFTGRLDTIEPSGETCDIAAGVARALEEIGQLRRRGDKNHQGIVVIASSVTPAANQPVEKLEAALKNLREQIGEEEWQIQYCYLNGLRDPHIEDFVSSKAGLSYDIDTLASERNADPIEELYRILSTPERFSPPEILDLKGAILGKGETSKEWAPLKVGAHIPEKTRLRVASGSRAVIQLENCGKLGLSPETHLTVVNARQNPLTSWGSFDMALEAGSIWMSLERQSQSIFKLTTPSGAIELSGPAAHAQYKDQALGLRLNSLSADLSLNMAGTADEPLKLGLNKSLRLANGKVVGEVEPVQASVLEKWKAWDNALSRAVPLAALNFVAPEIIFPNEVIALGPVRSKETQSQDFALRVIGVENMADLKINISLAFDLPEGLALSTGIADGKEPDTKILNIRVDGSAGFKSGRSDTQMGFLWLSPAPESRALFAEIGIPITITTTGPIVPTPVLLGVLGAVLAVAVAATAWKLRGSKSGMTLRPHAVIGRLIIVNDPTGGRVGTVNLEELGTKSSRLSLVVGRDRTAEVRLRHRSVSSAHCVLEASLAAGRLQTFIEPVEGAKVTVDGVAIRSKTRLADGAKLEVGDFTFQYEDTQMYKKVEVVRRNGRQISGILDASGMDAEGFRLSPADAVSPSERARIKFADIRYAIFYRRVVDILSGTPRPMPKPDTMKRVELMFKKGNTISGYIQREYAEGRRRYVELLPLETGSDIDYTVVDYAAVVEKRTL
jgi:hypothetical protein